MLLNTFWKKFFSYDTFTKSIAHSFLIVNTISLKSPELYVVETQGWWASLHASLGPESLRPSVPEMHTIHAQEVT